jgi:hypothetical protein
MARRGARARLRHGGRRVVLAAALVALGAASAGLGATRTGLSATGPALGAPSAGLSTGLGVAGTRLAAAGAAPARPAPPVEPRFEPAAAERGPFPSDRLTVPDPTQRTGLRVALPLPNCDAERSACEEIRLLNELDGFDSSPRLALRFTGPVDPGSVGPRSLFLVRLAPGPPEATGVERIVYDPATHTLYARPEALLEPETRYGLVVTRRLRDAAGRPIRAAPAFHRFLGARDGDAGVRAYRRGLGVLMAALARRGVRADEVAVATVFTTASVTGFLEQARDGLDRHPSPPALITAPEGGGRAYFLRPALRGLVLRRQVRVLPDDAPAPADAFEETPLPLAVLPDAVGGLGIGWFWSPWYLTSERRIVELATARPLGEAPLAMPVPFVVLMPAGSPPPGGWPLVLVGHGYGGEMFSTALRIAGTLARHGLATAALTVVGHGGGPESRLVVTPATGDPLEVRVPGRGVDLDGDARIGGTEGLATLASGSLASLGLRDGLRQQVVDLMAFVRAVAHGLDVDGDGLADTRGAPIYYVGQSLGGIYGTMLLAVDPRVEVGVLNVPGGPIPEIARLSPVFRPLLRQALERRVPPLLNAGDDFREDLPLRGEPPVLGPAPGALPVQEYLARLEWLGRRGDAVAYARHLRAAPLPGQEAKRVLVQLAAGDRVVPNPTTSALVRAGQLADATVLVRYERLGHGLPKELAEPHAFLLRLAAPGPVGALARTAQEQVARFFAGDGAAVWDPAGPLFEIPAAVLPERLGFPPGE